MRMKQKVFSIFALLLMAATGAWAQSAFTAKKITSASQLTSTDDEAYVAACMPSDFLAVDINVAKAWTGAPTDDSAILIYAIDGDKIKMATFINGSNKATTGATWSIATFKNQLTNGKFFYTAPPTYSVTLAEGTEDEGNWTISPTEAAEGSPVIATYNGEKKVKSVKAVKKAAGNAYLTWDADQKKLVATEIPTTATKVENADAGVNWEAGTYVVDGDVTIKGNIRLSGDVNLIIKDDATLTANKIQGGNKNLRIYGQANRSGQLVVNSTTDAISNITTLEVHSAKVTASASTNICGGFLGITTFNVYGGLVDAKGTGSNGYGITLHENGSLNIYGGEVKAEGKGNNVNYSYGIRCGNSVKATVTVYGGKLWAGNANNKALKYITLAIDKSLGFNGEIETSSDNSTWHETVGTPDEKYVRVGY